MVVATRFAPLLHLLGGFTATCTGARSMRADACGSVRLLRDPCERNGKLFSNFVNALGATTLAFDASLVAGEIDDVSAELVNETLLRRVQIQKP